MSKNRLSYNQIGLFVSSAPSNLNESNQSSGIYKLDYVQDFTFSETQNRVSESQIGSKEFSYNFPFETPNVEFGFSWIETDGINLAKLGFTTNNSGQLIADLTGQFDRNFYLVVSQNQHEDFENLVDFSGCKMVAIGNCHPKSLQLDLSVGEVGRSQISYDASYYYSREFTETGLAPSISNSGTRNESISYSLDADLFTGNANASNFDYIVKPDKIILDLDSYTLSNYRLENVQSVSISIPLEHRPIVSMGESFVRKRKLKQPQNGSVQFSAIVGKEKTAEINNWQDNENLSFSFGFDDTSGVRYMNWTVSNAKFQSFSWGHSIGGYQSFSAEFIFDFNNFTISGNNTIVVLNPLGPYICWPATFY